MSTTGKIAKLLLPAVLIAAAVIVGAVIIKTTRKPEKKRPQRTAYAVTVMPLTAEDHPVSIHVTGTVAPAIELTLRTKVAGEIIKVSPEFIDGGSFKKGEKILKIDPVDYKLALEQKRAALANAEYHLKLEEGRADIAAREWELLEAGGDASEADRELALRVPHLKYARAQLEAARAEVEKAELDLERTDIRAPFNAVVVSQVANLGAQASIQDTLAMLAASDQYYVRASIPIDQLRWIECDPDNGSPAAITRGTGDVRKGHAIRTESSLEEMGRMARIIIGIDNPLQGDSPVLLNEYVRVTVEGSSIEDAFKVPRSALHDDRYVWIAAPDDTLAIREVTVAWRNSDTVIITDGLQDGERLILTRLSTPISGMQIRIANDPAGGKGPETDEE